MKDMNNVKETGIITEVDRYLFGEGTHYEAFILAPLRNTS